MTAHLEVIDHAAKVQAACLGIVVAVFLYIEARVTVEKGGGGEEEAEKGNRKRSTTTCRREMIPIMRKQLEKSEFRGPWQHREGEKVKRNKKTSEREGEEEGDVQDLSRNGGDHGCWQEGKRRENRT